MIKLLTENKLSRTTLRWTKDYGSEWRPLDQTNLWSTNRNSGPPPLPPSGVGNFYAYIFALIPLIGSIVEAFASESSADPDAWGSGGSFAVYMIAYLIVAGLDARVIRRSGNQAVAPTAWFWLAPVYLWVRAKRLGQSRMYFWLWVACFIVSIFVDLPQIKGYMYLGFGMPSCKSAFATTHASIIFSEIPINKAAEVSVIEFKDVIDHGIEEGRRVCEASVLTNVDKEMKFHYEIENKDDQFYIHGQIVYY